MSGTDALQPKITVEAGPDGLADIASLPWGPPATQEPVAREPVPDAGLEAALYPGGYYSLLRAGDGAAAQLGVAEPADPGMFDAGDAD